MEDIVKGLAIALTSSLLSSFFAFAIGSYRTTAKLMESFGKQFTALETTVSMIDQRLERMERAQDNERARHQP